MTKSYKLIDKRSVRSNRSLSQKPIVLFDMFIAEEVRLMKTGCRFNMLVDILILDFGKVSSCNSKAHHSHPV